MDATRVISAVGVVFVVAFSGCCIPKRPLESAKVLREIATPADTRRGEPQLIDLRYQVGSRHHSGDLYLPARPRAGVVLVPGAAEEGKRHPLLVAFAKTLARADFAVLVPDLVNVRELRVGPRDVRDIADAFVALASQGDLAPEGRAGIIALSYAVGPVVLAALEADVQGKIDFVLGVGGYHDLREVIVFFTTGYFRDRTQPEPRWRYMKPNEYGKWAFLRSNVERVADSTDRELLRQMATRKLENAAAPVDDLARRLGQEGRTYYNLLTNRDPERAFKLIDELPSAVRNEIRALDLARRNLSSLQARLILVHGRGDRLIPYTESKALAQSVPRAKLTLLGGLAHVELEEVGLADALRLLCVVDELLAQRVR